MDLSIILIGVEHPGNLGAVARAMKNFGCTRLLLIEPKCSPSDAEAKKRAKWANDILEGATIGSFDLLEGFDLVIATTAELGNDFNLPRTPILPSQLRERLTEREGKIALLFGRESDGLTNEEIARSDFSLTIPSNADYPVLNLSHAVAVTLALLLSERFEPGLEERFPLVKSAEKRQLLKMIDERLDTMEFSTPEKRATQRLLWKRLVAKSFLTQREAMALMGFFSRL